MTTAKDKTFVTKTVTVGVDDNTLKGINDAAKTVGAGNDAQVSLGGSVQKNSDATEYSLSSVTFTWTEEV